MTTNRCCGIGLLGGQCLSMGLQLDQLQDVLVSTVVPQPASVVCIGLGRRRFGRRPPKPGLSLVEFLRAP